MKYHSLKLFLVFAGIAASTALCSDWQISAGPTYHFGSKVTMRGGSSTQNDRLHAAAVYERDPSLAGNLLVTADRTYSDGYVMKDGGTDNPDAIGGPGYTWNWGFETASQWNPEQHTLSFNAAGGERLQRASQNLRQNDYRSGSGLGFGVSAERFLRTVGKARFSGVVGFSFTDYDFPELQASSYREDYHKESYQIVDVFDAPGYEVGASPNQGTLAGPGPIISNLPTTRRRQGYSSVEKWSAANLITGTVDADEFDLHAGPRVVWEFGRFQAGAHLALVASWLEFDVARKETFARTANAPIARWNDHRSESTFLLGAELESSLRLRLNNKFSVETNVGYRAYGGDVDIAVGPGAFTFDPAGWHIGVRGVLTF